MVIRNPVDMLPTLELTQRFINECRVHPSVDRYALFSSLFKMPYDTIKLMEFYGMAKADAPLEELEEQLEKMHCLKIHSFIQDILKNLIVRFCPGKKTSVNLFLLDEHDKYGRENLGGVSAFTDYNGKLTFIVYPETEVLLVLESVITHEFHHFWRMGHLHVTEDNETLLDRLILEGLAEHFVGEVLGYDRQGPYARTITSKQAESLWVSDFRDHLDLKGEDTNLYMFGGENGLPHWAGYSMGYYLVQWYRERHTDLAIVDLTLLPSIDFVENVI